MKIVLSILFSIICVQAAWGFDSEAGEPGFNDGSGNIETKDEPEEEIDAEEIETKDEPEEGFFDLLALPNQVIYEILDRLELKERFYLAQVCHRLRNMLIRDRRYLLVDRNWDPSPPLLAAMENLPLEERFRLLARGDELSFAALLLDRPNINLGTPFLDRDYPETDLLRAVREGNIQEVRFLLGYEGSEDQGSDIEPSSTQEARTLSAAESLRLTGSQEARTFSDIESIRLAVEIAVTNENREMLRVLFGENLLGFALLLLDNPDLDVNTRDRYSNETPLIEAVRRGDIQLVEGLLADERTDINAGNSRGVTALNWAVELRDYEMVNLLLADPGVDINAGGTPGTMIRGFGANNPGTSLYLAVQNGDRAMVEILLADSRIDPTVVTHEFFGTPLDLAMEKPRARPYMEDEICLIELLLNHKSATQDPFINYLGANLRQAILYGNLEGMELLLRGRAPENQEVESVLKRYHKLVKYALNNNLINIHELNNGQNPPLLHEATELLNIELMRLLLARPSVDVNELYGELTALDLTRRRMLVNQRAVERNQEARDLLREFGGEYWYEHIARRAGQVAALIVLWSAGFGVSSLL